MLSVFGSEKLKNPVSSNNGIAMNTRVPAKKRFRLVKDAV